MIQPRMATEPAGAGSARAELHGFAWTAVWGSAALAVGVLLLTSTRYGYHRDELYFLEASRHLAWGYVDQPPLSVALVWLSHALFGQSLVGLRLFPALADGATVVLTGLLTRELGGKRFAQALAALAVALGPFLIAGHLAGPTAYDFVAWLLTTLLAVRILRTGEERLWLAVGLVVGLALLNKETVLLLVGALAVGFVVNRQASVFRSPWLWGGVAIALLIWSPNLVWQAHHGWPSREMSRNLQREHSGLGNTFKFIPIQLLLPGWWVAPVWMGGLWALWREERFRLFRAFAIAYAMLFVFLGLLIGDRPYYLAGLYPMLLAAGAIVAEGVVDGVRRFFSERPPGRRLVWRSRRAAAAFVVVLAVLGLPISIPVLPAAALATVPLQKINYNLGETIGWQELVATVAHVYRALSPAERASAAIVTANYGEAGAIDRYGPPLGLPVAFSGHNNYWWWGPPHPSIGVTIGVGGPNSSLTRFFRDVRLVATIHNIQGVKNDEEGTSVWLCRGQRAPWPAVWSAFRHYG